MKSTGEVAIGEGLDAGRLASVQYLRAIAAWSVVAYHLTASLAREAGSAPAFAIGAIGVDIFFILSGFLMAMIVDAKGGAGPGFFTRRLIRIVPLYWLMTIALFIIAMLVPGVLKSVLGDPAHLIASLFFLPYENATGGIQPVLSLGWTLNYEMAFYGLVVVFGGFFGDRTLLSVCAVLAAVAGLGTLVEAPGALLRFYTDPIILEFALGILLYRFVFRDRPASPREGLYWLALAAGILMLALSADLMQERWRFLTWGLPAALFVAGGLHSFSFASRWLQNLGDWSYSTYLVHVYVIQFAVMVVLPHLPGWAANPWLLALVLFPLIAAASALLHLRFEKPVMAWLTRLAASRRAAIA